MGKQVPPKDNFRIARDPRAIFRKFHCHWWKTRLEFARTISNSLTAVESASLDHTGPCPAVCEGGYLIKNLSPNFR